VRMLHVYVRVHVHTRVLPHDHPTQVLCAFELLLREAGGVLSDVYGEPIDLLSEACSLVITPTHAHAHARAHGTCTCTCTCTWHMHMCM
jgi:fructose-1,6-bisphosphatase/inositol monophosphatase family enzyme